jgi:chaperonin cofactor prefoldin
MASLEEALAAKTLELETLQRSFDEYLESSKDLESELEKSLADAEAKLATSENKRRTAEEKLKALQDQCSYYEKASNSTNDELAKLREKVELLEKQKVKNEIENEDLSNQLRVLESNEESMREKINKLEEEVILANSETENVALASKDSERRLLDRIEELVSLTSANHASSEPAEEGKVENAKALAVPPVEVVEVASPPTSTIGSLTPKPPAEIPPQERGRIFEDDFVVKRKITDALATADAETIRGELLNMVSYVVSLITVLLVCVAANAVVLTPPAVEQVRSPQVAQHQAVVQDPIPSWQYSSVLSYSSSSRSRATRGWTADRGRE